MHSRQCNKGASPELGRAPFGSREVSLERIFNALSRKIISPSYLSQVYLENKSSLFSTTDSHEVPRLVTRMRILTRSKVVARKVLNGLKRNSPLSKSFAKRITAKIFVSPLLELLLRKCGANVGIFKVPKMLRRNI